MNKKLKVLIFCIIVFLTVSTTYGIIKRKNIENNSQSIKIVTSFYPLYIMTSNLTKGAQNVETTNMTDKLTGCIHDYTLTTEDLKKIENADIFIEGGNGLESFNDKITSAYPNLKIINTSDNIENFIYNDDEINAHIWLSINNYINELTNIKNELIKIDINNELIYKNNYDDYISKLNELKEKYKDINFENKKAICLNESIEYFLRDNSINDTLIETDHDQASLSADLVKEIIEKMKREKIDLIFIDKNDNDKTAKMIENETGAKVYRLNSAMNGVNSLDEYLKAMEYNYKVLSSINNNI